MRATTPVTPPDGIHRDIKPANIIVPAGGEGATLVDFGIAKEYEQDGTTTAVRHGSPGYSAPEQYARGTNPRTDVYGLAATFYALLTGTVPADALWRITQLGSHGADPLVPVNHLAPQVPVVVAEAIQQAMSVNSDERFASVGALWRALQSHPVELASHAPLTPLPETRPVPQGPAPEVAALSATTVVSRPSRTRPVRRRTTGLLALTVMALVALLAGVLLATNLLLVPQRSGTTTAHKGAATQAISAPSTPTATHPAATAQATPVPATPTPIRPPSPASRPAPPPAVYPMVEGEYSGTIYNDPAAVGTTLSLSQVRQSGATMSGYVTVGPQLQGNGNFTGMVSTNKSLRFLVQPYGGHLPLLFTGQVHADGSLSGTYCSALDNQCDGNGGGYGTWNVSPVSLGS